MGKSTRTASPAGTRKTRSTAKNNAGRPNEQQIRERAYEIFLAEGARPGNELANWLRAERELVTSSPTQ